MRVPQNLWDTLFFMHAMAITLLPQVSGGWKASYRGLKLENILVSFTMDEKLLTTVKDGIFLYGHVTKTSIVEHALKTQVLVY